MPSASLGIGSGKRFGVYITYFTIIITSQSRLLLISSLLYFWFYWNRGAVVFSTYTTVLISDDLDSATAFAKAASRRCELREKGQTSPPPPTVSAAPSRFPRRVGAGPRDLRAPL